MHIAIDARFYGLTHAGLGRYTQNLVHQLVDYPSDHRYTLLLRQPVFSQLRLKPPHTTVLADVNHYSLAEQWQIPTLLAKIKPDLTHFLHFNLPYFYQQPFVVTIHDILWHQIKGSRVTTLPAPLYWFKYLAYRGVVNRAVSKSLHIVVPSQYVKNQLLNQFPHLHSSKISVTYEGVDSSFLTPPKSIPSPTVPKPYLIYTGSCYPHKNLDFLLSTLSTFQLTHASSLHLVIVTARNVFLDQVKQIIHRLGLNNQVHLYTSVSDQQLGSLYQGSSALIMSSLSEGFGLPGLEAMAMGTPVISSRAGALPEIYGPAACFFDPRKSATLITCLDRLLNNQTFRQKLIQAGLKQAQKYSWKKMAQDTLSVYCQVQNAHHL